MKRYIYSGLILIFSVGAIYSQLPSNFNNQQMLINRIEVNLGLIKNSIQNIMNNPADTPQTRNDLVMSVIKKDGCADEISEILCKEFLQKYISSSDPEVNEKLALVHKMLNLCFLLKTKVDMDFINSLEKKLSEFKEQLKLNYQIDPDYKPSRYRKYRPARNN